MSEDRGLLEVVTHPLTQAGGLAAILGGVLNLPLIGPVWSTIWAAAGKLFTVASLLAFTAAPRLPWLPERPLTVIALGLVGIVVWKRSDRILETFENNLRRQK